MAEVATFATSDQLLVVIDPVARQMDGESVRIAKDVLSAGAATKVCLPDGPEEFARALARRGARRPVVIGDDRALARAVALLHRQRELAGCALSVVPVGPLLGVAHALGVPSGAVAAARAVLDGAVRRLDVLVDDSDGVVLGALSVPPLGGSDPAAPAGGPQGAPVAPCAEELAAMGAWLRSCHARVRNLVASRPVRGGGGPGAGGAPVAWGDGPARLRVEVDGDTLVDLEQPVEGVSVTPGGAGSAAVEVRPVSIGAEAAPLRAAGRRITISGPDFRYRADAAVSGPVRRRTWTVWEGALGLVLPG
ncbi:diacylglycerol kinase [Streptomyces sp. NPDC048290]|uniref:diacylglycerol kinase n=1 Tax=Streptomyces sp. NPDC048290 TaxID=3155811 RepID=UPI00341F9AED